MNGSRHIVAASEKITWERFDQFDPMLDVDCDLIVLVSDFHNKLFSSVYMIMYYFAFIHLFDW